VVVVATMEVQVVPYVIYQVQGVHLTSAPAKPQWSPMLKE
jgi:hypothetical protein